MNFQTNDKKESYFLSQPHQPFFLSGIIWAVVFMILFLLSYKGVAQIIVAANEFHLYSLAFVVFIQFFHGFLFTTFPRFCSTNVVPKSVYKNIFMMYQIGSLVYTAGIFSSLVVVYIGVITLLMAQLLAIYTLYNIYKVSKVAMKTDQFWMLIAHIFGAVAHIIFAISIAMELLEVNYSLFFIASPLTVNMFLIFMTFSVAQRMVPFFSHSMVSKDSRLIYIVFGGFIIKTIASILGFSIIDAIVSIALSLIVAREFIRWKMTSKTAPAILTILHIAIFWLPLGLFLGGVATILEVFTQNSFYYLSQHLLLLGVLTTILIGFGTRVTLGHSGQSPFADRLTIAIFYLTQVVVLSRAALSIDVFVGAYARWLFDLSVLIWIIMFGLWAYRYGYTLIFGYKRAS